MFYLVYQITNTVNGKSYKGSHKTENKDDGYMGSGKLIRAAIKKYGIDAFKKDILFEASSSEEMFAKEKELVILGPQSYNLKHGGSGGFDFVNANYPLDKRLATCSVAGRIGGRVSANLCRGFLDPKYDDQRKVWGSLGDKNNFFGKKHTDEAKEKMRVGHKGLIPWNKGKKIGP